MIKLLATALITFTTTSAWAGECGTHHKITRQEIIAAQKAWGDGIVNIGATEDHKKAAMEHINKLYAYDMGHGIV